MMEEKSIKLEVPEGYEVDKKKSTFTNIIFKKKEKKGFYITNDSNIVETRFVGDRNVWPTKELAEAGLALTELVYLRDEINKGWKPDWDDEIYIIVYDGFGDNILITPQRFVTRVLHFKDEETACRFYNDNLNLIQSAKELI